jgi:hypothetical protein
MLYPSESFYIHALGSRTFLKTSLSALEVLWFKNSRVGGESVFHCQYLDFFLFILVFVVRNEVFIEA